MDDRDNRGSYTINSFSFKCIVKEDDVYIYEPSEAMFSFFGTSEEIYKDGIISRIRRDIGDASADAVRNIMLESADEGRDFRLAYPSVRADGSACNMQMDAYAEERTDDGQIYRIIEMDITDITQARKEAEKLAAANTALTEDSPVGIGLYNIKGDFFDLIYTNNEYYRVHHGSKEYWDSFSGSDAMNRIIPEDRNLIYEEWKKVLYGDTGTVFDATYRCRGEDGELHWIHLLARLTDEDENGMRKCYASYLNVDSEKKAEATAAGLLQEKLDDLKAHEAHLQKEYSAAQAANDAVSDVCIAALRVNLTDNKIEKFYLGGKDLALGSQYEYDTVLQNSIDSMPRGCDRAECMKLFSRPALIDSYRAGDPNITFEYFLRNKYIPGVWARREVRLVQRPDTDEIIAFDTEENITVSKVTEIMMNEIIGNQYDYINCIDTIGRTIEVISVNGRTAEEYDRIPHGPQDYEAFIRQNMEGHVLPEEYEDCTEFLDLDNIIKKLESVPKITSPFTLLTNQGKKYKLLSFCYIDKETNTIAMMSTDFTDSQKQQMEQEEKLRVALHAAQQANIAKSEFLSRMSHEIRTPMNAIIGLDILALEDPSLSFAVRDDLKKIGISANFLLSLINDILDMSRIESGKMVLRNEVFDFRKLIDDINMILHAQCREKNIDYECIIKGYTEEAYAGDETKLQQILINILGNSVKFTPPGGRIHFLIEQLSHDQERARMRFTITDTGKGIEEDFIPHIFDTFTQEENSNTTSYGGTGLGLSISKSLVEMMDGSIEVHSAKNMGSDFTVEVTLGLSSETIQWNRHVSNIDFTALKTLIVDDDIIVCQHTELILKQAGITAEWVCSGAEAIERIKSRNAAGNDYDLIVLDWKMPDMDGVTTAKEIRRIVGPNVTIIIITAYDWSDIEEKATRAGVNGFIRKPVFASSLMQAYEEIIDPETRISKKKSKYNFTGRTILLAEDNMINAEIARNLLELGGLKVDVTENGQEALTAFCQSTAGKYDAILMDIRMPIMDGLEATRAIRGSDHPDSNTIPIIAMSANAFDEDVRKSLESGMNEHLSKPVDVDILYETLDKLINQ